MYYLTQRRVLSGLFTRQAERDTSTSLASAELDRASRDGYSASKEDRRSADGEEEDDDEEAMEMLPRDSRHDAER